MALPARLTAALGRHPDALTEEDLQRAADSGVPEGVDLDWKKDPYTGADAGKRELAKDVSAMANTVGGLIVVGIDDAERDQASTLAPFTPESGRGEEWIRSVLANWIQPVVPNVGVRFLESARQPGRSYLFLTVPRSVRAPHAVAAPGNDHNFRVHVRHGTTTRTLSESEIAQRYRDRFQAATGDADRLTQLADAGLGYLRDQWHTDSDTDGRQQWADLPCWFSMTALPAVRGDYPLITRAQRRAAFDRFGTLTDACVTSCLQPAEPLLPGRRQVRFKGVPTGQLHQDGSSYTALPLHLADDRRSPQGPRLLYQPDFEAHLLSQVQAAAAWAAETAAAGDLMLSAAFHRFDGKHEPVRLTANSNSFQRGPVGALPQTPARTVAELTTLATDLREAVITAYTLAADLLADIGAHEPHRLTPDGEFR